MKKIIITGGAGFLGTQIIKYFLEHTNYQLVVMDIVPPRVDNSRVSFVKHNLLNPILEPDEQLKNPDIYIHLSGKNIAGRFTYKHKQLIYDTRIIGTRNLIQLFQQSEYRPRKIVAASAVGYYGNQPGVILDESSESKNGMFLSQVVIDWEKEVQTAQDLGIKTTCIRNAHIIGQGGMLQETAKGFRFGIGTILGWHPVHMPWIDIRDLVRLYALAVDNHTPLVINGVSNRDAITYKDFARAIAQHTSTHILIPVPKWVLRLGLGQFADEILVDQHVISAEYSSINFIPKYTDIYDVVGDYLQDKEQ